jgi:hypothetical protein
LGFHSFSLGVPIYPNFRDRATAGIAMEKSFENLTILLSKFVPHRDCATDGARIGTNLVPLPTLNTGATDPISWDGHGWSADLFGSGKRGI